MSKIVVSLEDRSYTIVGLIPENATVIIKGGKKEGLAFVASVIREMAEEIERLREIISNSEKAEKETK